MVSQLLGRADQTVLVQLSTSWLSDGFAGALLGDKCWTKGRASPAGLRLAPRGKKIINKIAQTNKGQGDRMCRGSVHVQENLTWQRKKAKNATALSELHMVIPGDFQFWTVKEGGIPIPRSRWASDESRNPGHRRHGTSNRWHRPSTSRRGDRGTKWIELGLGQGRMISICLYKAVTM